MATIEQIDERIEFHRELADGHKAWADRFDLDVTAIKRHSDGSEAEKTALGDAVQLRDRKLRQWHEQHAVIRALEAWKVEIKGAQE